MIILPLDIAFLLIKKGEKYGTLRMRIQYIN